jgi:hypothetical protein
MLDNTIVPKDPKNEVRRIFQLPQPSTISDLMESKEWKLLKKEYQKAAKGKNIKPIDLSDIINWQGGYFNLTNFWIDFVVQRERLKYVSTRRRIIKLALEYDPILAGIPTGAVDELHRVNSTNWFKRACANILRGQTEYPVAFVKVPQSELASHFNSQFENNDKQDPFQVHKTKLVEGNIQAWALQRAFQRNRVTAYPVPDEPMLKGYTYIREAMLDPSINPDDADKVLGDKKFKNFGRAITVHRLVFPNHSKVGFGGSIIAGLMSVIASLDDISQGDDSLLVKILTEAKDKKYKIRQNKNEEWEGFISPANFTNQAMGWQGNKLRKAPIITTAKMWNIIIGQNPEWDIPAIDSQCIDNFEASGDYFRKMK